MLYPPAGVWGGLITSEVPVAAPSFPLQASFTLGAWGRDADPVQTAVVPHDWQPESVDGGLAGWLGPAGWVRPQSK